MHTDIHCTYTHTIVILFKCTIYRHIIADRHSLYYLLLLRDKLKWRGDEDIGDGFVERAVADGYQIDDGVATQHWKEVVGHTLPEMEEKVLHLHTVCVCVCACVCVCVCVHAYMHKLKSTYNVRVSIFP